MILNSSPDYETKASYNIYINVNDGANNYAKAFTVSVTNINEAPSDLSFEAGAEFIDGMILQVELEVILTLTKEDQHGAEVK